MKKVLVATVKPFAQAAVDGIREIVENSGNKLILLEKYNDQSELISAVADVDALIIRSDKVTKEVIEAAKNLKIVVRAGAGYDNVDLDAANEKGIVVMNTPGQNSNAVAELAAGMAIYMARNAYNGKSGTELRGKKLGIHAYGNVGRYVARIAKGFGMDVYAFDPFVNQEQMKAEGVEPLATVEDLYKTCNYISLHIPAIKPTLKSINFSLLSEMPSPAVLINTARKEVIDEAGLMKVMEKRDDFAYISDIAPDCKDEIEEKFDSKKYFFTPKKMGAQTSEANINAGKAAANQITSYFQTGDETFRVNK